MTTTPNSHNVSRLKDKINCGEVNRAAWPNYVGTTPDYSKDPPLKMKGSMTMNNRKANERAKSLLTSGTFKTPEKFVVDNKDDRRIWPLEYRGPNLSNCLYTTATSFNAARKNQRPQNLLSPDLNYPIGGGQTN